MRRRPPLLLPPLLPLRRRLRLLRLLRPVRLMRWLLLRPLLRLLELLAQLLLQPLQLLLLQLPLLGVAKCCTRRAERNEHVALAAADDVHPSLTRLPLALVLHEEAAVLTQVHVQLP